MQRVRHYFGVWAFLSFLTVLGVSAPAVAQSSSSDTYTYLRCYYRTSTQAGDPRVAYVWGLDPASSSRTYYKLRGYWYSSANFGVQNMFYSTATPASLRAVCASTQAKLGINKTHAQYAAADSASSFDYAVWANHAAPKPNGPVDNLISFGDSLSDTGNVFNGTSWVAPNRNSWFWGRFSNGPVWIEHVKSNLNLSLYPGAVGGAGVQTQSVVLPGLNEQVSTWASYAASARNHNAQNSLATIFIGGNDLISYQTSVAVMTNTVQTAIQTLLNAGVTRILVMGLPDVSLSPMVRLRGDQTTIASNVKTYNSNLQAIVQNHNASGHAGVKFYDTDAYVSRVMKSPQTYGFSNTTESCQNNTSGANDYTRVMSLRSTCRDADRFMFWDLLHPSAKVHKLIGDDVTSFISAQY